MADYRIHRIDVSAPLDRLEVVPRNVQIADVGILWLSPTMVSGDSQGKVFLHFGSDGEPIPLFLMGQNFERKPPQNDGIYVSTSGCAAGDELVLLVGTAVKATGGDK